LGEELLTPTTIYVKPVLDLIAQVKVLGMAHITGGGFPGNIPRVLPDSCKALIRKGSWEVPPIFKMLQQEAGLDDDEMFRTFNMGVGMVIIVPADQAHKAVGILETHGVETFVLGEVVPREPGDEPIFIV
jgi:phosphoribosylformylglycinamidine cyclo-ligase